MSSKSIYFAGELFDHKHLTGNALLAAAIESCSEQRYQCVLPQLLEQTTARAVDIRDNDLKQVLDCDVSLFNFDGTELDSGTVVEFMYAKFLDKPCVILRTDFRAGGDQEKGDPWNLMCSFYPRTRTILVNGMASYQQAMQVEGTLEEKLASYHQELASQVVKAFDEVCAEPSVMQQANVDIEQINRWAKALVGKSFEKLCG